MHKLAIIIVATACYFYVEGRSEDEPKCYSRFDYEYKVVEKLFECETAHKKQMEMIAELKDALDIVKSSSDDMRRELDITKEDSSSALDMINGGLKRGDPVAFSAGLNRKLVLTSNGKIVFNQLILNEGDGYDETTGIFTCPKTGLYLVTFFIGVRGTSQAFATLVVNDKRIVEAVAEGKHSLQDLQGGNAVVVKLNKGDLMWVQENAGGSILESYGSGIRTSAFSAVLFHPME